MSALPIPLNFQSGTQRDGTPLDANRALDALWCRWRNGRPRKIPGFRLITDLLEDVPRRVHMFYNGANVYVHVGTASTLQQIVIDLSGTVVSVTDRTPAGLVGGPALGWTLDSVFDTTSNVVQLIAHAVPDLLHVASSDQTLPYLGQIDGGAAVMPFTNPGALGGGTYAPPLIAGGVVAVQPYLFSFDFAGNVMWSAPNLPQYLGVTGGTTGAGSARVSAQKIVAGAPLRGGGVNSPAVIFWSLSEVIVGTFVGAVADFAFNTVSPSSSILSTDCMIEYDGLYFWAGTDRFMVYNGTVQEVPNPQNQDWFFDNLNRSYAAKCFAFKVPRYGEIWWCAPMFGNTEPSHAIIYNVRESCWYDTALPGAGRSAGYFAQGVPFPVMGEPVRTANGYKLWMHEIGTDQIQTGALALPVRSYFDTPYFSGPKLDPPTDEGLSLQQLEPDITQSGDLLITIMGRINARAAELSELAVTLKANASIPQEQFASFKAQRRLARMRVESNTLNGNYIVGRNLIHATGASDKRLTG